eukprot:g16452.t1
MPSAFGILAEILAKRLPLDLQLLLDLLEPLWLLVFSSQPPQQLQWQLQRLEQHLQRPLPLRPLRTVGGRGPLALGNFPRLPLLHLELLPLQRQLLPVLQRLPALGAWAQPLPVSPQQV